MSRFKTRRIKDLTERFNSISEEESLAVKSFIFKIEGKIDLDIYKDYDRIKNLGEILNQRKMT